MDEGFTATAYPKAQENLKLTVEEQVLLEEPASSSGTLSSLQHLTKDLSFGDLFFNDKPLEADNNKATAETKAEKWCRPESPKVHLQLKATATETTTTTTTSLPPPYQQQQSIVEAMMMKRIDIPRQVSKSVNEVVTNAIDWAMQAPIRNRFRDLPSADIKDILHQCMWETDSYKSHEDHMQLYEALEKSMNHDNSEELTKDLAEARKKKKSRESPKMPPGSPPHQPPPPPLPAGPSRASGSPAAFGSSQVLPPPPLPPSTNQETLASNYSPPLEDSLLTQTGDIAMFMDWFCKRRGITELKPQDLEGPAFEIGKVINPDVIHLQYQMEECHKLLTDSVDDSILRHNVSKPLLLGGPPGQVTIQSDFFFNKDLEYLRYGSKGSRPALSISKMKAAYYSDVGLEQMVPDQIWIKEECKYDITAIAVKTHMRILSVVRIEVFSMYRHLVIRQRVEDFQLGIESYQTQLNLTKPRWDATGFEYKHDYTVIDSPRDHIDEALDYQVKEFKINRMNPGLNTRFWTRKDIDRSKAFMFAIQKRLKTRRIFHNLESFVGRRVKDGDYRLLKLDIEKVAVCSSLRSLKPKRTIESSAKRSSKIISSGHYSIMLASSRTVKSKTDIKSPTHYPCGIARTSE
nr:hypothetical protein [Tanacetum cinerariifolium]